MSAQDGKLLDKAEFHIADSVMQRISAFDPDLSSVLKAVRFYRLTYLSDGLKVTGFMAEPDAHELLPCLILNRGGNRDFGEWNPMSIAFLLGRMASWGYVVVASQYRGNDGGEGKEEFGGQDINDVLNLVPVLSQLPNADTSRIGIQGGSRGGMMTYLALRESCRFKAAVTVAGMANAFVNIESRPEMEEHVFAQLVPDYQTNKETALRDRSAVYWADQLCKSTPLLLIHGSADWRVLPEESFELVEKLYRYKHPVRFILYEGADHGIREFRNEMFAEMRAFFDTYVRDGKPIPNMDPHGR